MSILSITGNVLDLSRSEDFAGYDPFDGLNSRFFESIPVMKKGVVGLSLIQLFKRSPINFRPLLGVAKKRNPKGIGLFILGLIEDYKRSQNQHYLNEAIELGNWLLSQKSDGAEWQYPCWGYHFDWNARAFFVPKGKPNVITTVYVSQALFSLSRVTGDAKYRKPALDSAHFIVEELYTKVDDRCFFAYIPGETAFVHNASLWAASWVAFVASETKNNQYRELALDVARQSVSEQSEEGAWVYGARHHHQFIDGFHTGYNLEALHLLRCSLEVDEFDEVIARGLTYYKRHLFEDDGTAKYYHNNRYPLDMHSVSQAVLTLLKVGETKADFQLAEKVINRAIDTLYLTKKKHFLYQKHKYFTNKINYIRWTQAWVYYSFSLFNRMNMDTPEL